MNKRMIVDTGMLISFLVLLDYRFVRNFGHETLAIVFFLLFLLHTWFNKQWYASLGRGRWNMDRKLTFLADVLLLGSFAAVMGSGLMISHTLPTGMQKAPLLAHQVHHVAGYVMLIALGFHLGLHWSAILSRLERGLGFGKIPHLSLVYKVLLLLIAAGGHLFLPLLQHRKQASPSPHPQCKEHSCHPLDLYLRPPSYPFPLCSSCLLCAEILPAEETETGAVIGMKKTGAENRSCFFMLISLPRSSRPS